MIVNQKLFFFSKLCGLLILDGCNLNGAWKMIFFGGYIISTDFIVKKKKNEKKAHVRQFFSQNFPR